MKSVMKFSRMACVAVSFVTLTSMSSKAQDYTPPPAQVEVVTASMRLMAPQMEANATVISLNNAQISTEVEGPVVWLANVGTKVAKGDVIARIDDRLLAIAERRAKANVAGLKADLVFREADVERFKELATRDVASKARLDAVIAERDKVKEQINDAEASLDLARGDLARTQIRAPFAGHIVQRLANVGEYLTVGKEVIRLVDTENMEVAIAAPLAIRPYLKQGLAVEARTELGVQMLPIRTVVPVGEQTSRMMEVRLSLPSDDWIVGTPVSVILPKGEAKQSVSVPRDALILKGSTFYLFRVNADNKAEQLRVEVDAAVGNWVSLKGGVVAAGDKVIIRGGERLQPNASVVIK